MRPDISDYQKKLEADAETLLQNIKRHLPELEELLSDLNKHWAVEDHVCRFYHHSFKVYWLQNYTIRILGCIRILGWLSRLKPRECELNPMFMEIVLQGTDKAWRHAHNRAWTHHTRPILEALFHAKYFLEMAVKYGRELEKAPDMLPSGWAALLHLYGMR